jgi:FtsP/CotA-like multicopper oxidase with cupredoxin domain
MPKNEAENGPDVEQKTEGRISRRNVLKIGAAAGAVGVLAPSVLTSSEVLGFQGSVAEPVRCDTDPLNPAGPGPDHVPFVDEFAAPFPAVDLEELVPPPQKVANTPAEAPRADHQRWEQFTPAHFMYEMDARAGLHTFHSNFSPTYVWGFNGVYPAPTCLQRYGKSTIVRFKNNLPATTTTFGRNEITIHLHNGHHGSESDGFAGDFFTRGFYKDHLYPNCYAGLDAFGDNGDPKEKMGSFWFHDHRAEFTLNNNFLGLNGMFLVYDKTDPGHEHPSNDSLQLPGYYGITDFPVILTDKRFCLTANGRTEMVNSIGGTNKWIVNGKIQPRMVVRRRKYRFRFLNTGPIKDWNITLVKADASNVAQVQTITVVATDANFLEHPIKIDAGANAGNSNSTTNPGLTPGGLRVSVAERYDVIIDFAQYAAGDVLYLKETSIMRVNGAPNINPPGFPTNLNIGQVLIKFEVVNREPWFPKDTPAIPETLCTYPDLPVHTAEFEWQFVRDPACPPGTVNVPPRQFRVRRPRDEFGNPLDGPLGCLFDPEDPAHCIKRGSTERWLLNNNVGGSAWTHPVHIHFEEFRTLRRFVNGVETIPAVPPLMTGRKDVSRLEATQGAELQMQFRDYNGRYLIHCHNMAHEDAFMMVRWDICPDQASFDACIADRQVCQAVLECSPTPTPTP